jgi:hypothetical protein
MTETPNLRWFDRTDRPCAMCGKRSSGLLRGALNESYGPHCQKCANRRLKASEKVRREMLATGPLT